MPRYAHPSKYFADDKDVADILDAPKFNKKKLLNIALSRGLLLSDDLAVETLRDFMSRTPLSWPQLKELLGTIETPDSEEKLTTFRIESGVTLDVLQTTIADVQAIRGECDKETYATRLVEGGVLVHITYSEVDQQMTRVLQRVRKEMDILITPIEGGYDFRYPANKRAQAIVDKIAASLPVPEGSEKPQKQTLDLSAVVDPSMRTEFFILLMDSMNGFKRRNVIDLKMNRIPKEEEPDDDHDDDDDADDEESAIKDAGEKMFGLVKRMSLTGEALLSSPQFAQLKKDGFCISRTVWESIEIQGAGRVFELEALFKDGEGGKGFCYLVRGVHNHGDDGELEVTKKPLSLDDRKMMEQRIEEAAYAAMTAIRAKLETAASTAAKPSANGT